MRLMRRSYLSILMVAPVLLLPFFTYAQGWSISTVSPQHQAMIDEFNRREFNAFDANSGESNSQEDNSSFLETDPSEPPSSNDTSFHRASSLEELITRPPAGVNTKDCKKYTPRYFRQNFQSADEYGNLSLVTLSSQSSRSKASYIDDYEGIASCLESDFVSEFFKKQSLAIELMLQKENSAYRISNISSSIKKNKEQELSYANQIASISTQLKQIKEQQEKLLQEKDRSLGNNIYGPFIIFGMMICDSNQILLDERYSLLEETLESNLELFVPTLVTVSNKEQRKIQKYDIYPVGLKVQGWGVTKNNKPAYMVFRPAILRPNFNDSNLAQPTKRHKRSKQPSNQCRTVCNFSMPYEEFLAKNKNDSLLNSTNSIPTWLQKKIKTCASASKRRSSRRMSTHILKSLSGILKGVREKKQLNRSILTLDRLIIDFMKSNQQDSQGVSSRNDNGITEGYIYKTSLTQQFDQLRDFLKDKVESIRIEESSINRALNSIRESNRIEMNNLKNSCEEYKDSARRLNLEQESIQKNLSKTQRLVIVEDNKVPLSRDQALSEMLKKSRDQAQNSIKKAHREDVYFDSIQGIMHTKHKESISKNLMSKDIRLLSYHVITSDRRKDNDKEVDLKVAYLYEITVNIIKILERSYRKSVLQSRNVKIENSDVDNLMPRVEDFPDVKFLNQEGVALMKRPDWSYPEIQRFIERMNTDKIKWRLLKPADMVDFRTLCSNSEYQNESSCRCSWTQEVAYKNRRGESLAFPGHYVFSFNNQSRGRRRSTSKIMTPEEIDREVQRRCPNSSDTDPFGASSDDLFDQIDNTEQTTCEQTARAELNRQAQRAKKANSFDVVRRISLIDNQGCGAVLVQEEEIMESSDIETSSNDNSLAICREFNF